MLLYSHSIIFDYPMANYRKKDLNLANTFTLTSVTILNRHDSIPIQSRQANKERQLIVRSRGPMFTSLDLIVLCDWHKVKKMARIVVIIIRKIITFCIFFAHGSRTAHAFGLKFTLCTSPYLGQHVCKFTYVQ